MIDLPDNEYWIEVKILTSSDNRKEPTEVKSFETFNDSEGVLRYVFD